MDTWLFAKGAITAAKKEHEAYSQLPPRSLSDQFNPK